VELGLPSEDSAVELLLLSAGLKLMSPPPREILEIVKICGRLPLALDIAGKMLIGLVDDDAADSNWAGVPDMLRAEMQRAGDGEEDNLEYRVIKASLNFIPDGLRDDVQNVFKVFAIVPEDCFVPPTIFRLVRSPLHYYDSS
jgi:hypothetical protein